MDDVFIHETAEVSDKAIIGDGTKIWNQAQVRNNAELSENCIISKNVYIDEHVKIGNRVKVQNNVNVYHGVTIEDDVFLGPSMTFTNDMYPRSFNSDWRITETLVKRRFNWCQCNNNMWSYDRRICNRWCRKCSRQRCNITGIGGGKSGSSDWMGLPLWVQA